MSSDASLPDPKTHVKLSYTIPLTNVMLYIHEKLLTAVNL